MANNKQGTRIGPGAHNIAPGTEKKIQQSLQSQIALQAQNNTKNNSNNTKNNSNNTFFTQIKGYLDTLVQKITHSNDAILRTEKLLNSLSKKIDSALLAKTSENKQSFQTNQETTTKLLEDFIKKFKNEDFKRLLASVENINTKLLLFNLNSETSAETKLNENAVLTYLKEIDSTQKQFIEKFDSSAEELKNYNTAINNFILNNETKSNTISTNDLKVLATQFTVGLEAISNKLDQRDSGHLYNFAETSEKFDKTIDGLITTLKESEQSRVSIDSKIYGSVEKFLADIKNNLNKPSEQPKKISQQKIEAETDSGKKPSFLQSILPNKIEEYVSRLNNTIESELKKFKDALIESGSKEKQPRVIYIPQQIKQNNESVKAPKETTVINVYSHVVNQKKDEQTKSANEVSQNTVSPTSKPENTTNVKSEQKQIENTSDQSNKSKKTTENRQQENKKEIQTELTPQSDKINNNISVTVNSGLTGKKQKISKTESKVPGNQKIESNNQKPVLSVKPFFPLGQHRKFKK